MPDRAALPVRVYLYVIAIVALILTAPLFALYFLLAVTYPVDYLGEPRVSLELLAWLSALGLGGAGIAVYGLVKRLVVPALAGAGLHALGTIGLLAFFRPARENYEFVAIYLGLALVLAIDAYIIVTARHFEHRRRRTDWASRA